MKVYHGQADNAFLYLLNNVAAVNRAGGLLAVSNGDGLTPDILVLELPDGVEPTTVAQGVNWTEANYTDQQLLPGETSEQEQTEGEQTGKQSGEDGTEPQPVLA